MLRQHTDNGTNGDEKHRKKKKIIGEKKDSDNATTGAKSTHTGRKLKFKNKTPEPLLSPGSHPPRAASPCPPSRLRASPGPRGAGGSSPHKAPPGRGVCGGGRRVAAAGPGPGFLPRSPVSPCRRKRSSCSTAMALTMRSEAWSSEYSVKAMAAPPGREPAAERDVAGVRVVNGAGFVNGAGVADGADVVKGRDLRRGRGLRARGGVAELLVEPWVALGFRGLGAPVGP